jgi:transposase-like protein
MPWKETGVVELRMEVVIRHVEGERVSALSREYGVSRQTIHKWIRRFRVEGACGLFDRPRDESSSYARSTAGEGAISEIFWRKKASRSQQLR